MDSEQYKNNFPLIHFYLFSKIDQETLKKSTKSQACQILASKVIEIINQEISTFKSTTNIHNLSRSEMDNGDDSKESNIDFEVCVEEERIVRDVSPSKSFPKFLRVFMIEIYFLLLNSDDVYWI